MLEEEQGLRAFMMASKEDRRLEVTKITYLEPAVSHRHTEERLACKRSVASQDADPLDPLHC